MFKNKELGYKELTILVIVAYIFSFTMRLIWVFQFKDNPDFLWNNQLMINTNDGYFFASAVDYILNGLHADNPRVQIAIDSYPGMVYTSYFLVKFTPMSLETAILYAPSIVSSLVVIPIIFTGKLIKLPWVGFFAALLGSIAWSYYNRTMTGYYDTDMFSVLLQFTTLYLFLLTLYNKDSKTVLFLAISLLIYPLFYPQGLSLIYAIFMLWVLYQLIFQRDKPNSYLFIAIASIALWNVFIFIKLIIISLLFLSINKIEEKLNIKKLFYFALGSIFLFFLFGNVFGLILGKIAGYMDRGVTEEGLHFYQVIQTVREAGSISWETVANRIIGGFIPLTISIIGYMLLVVKHKQFLIALPLIGVGIFAHWAGLRFTVYAVPVAAFSAIYLFWIVSEKFIKNKVAQYSFFVILTVAILYPNITHIIGYKVPTVLNKTEVMDLVKLNKISNPKDYTLAWWDYGYPLWYYSNTSTLIDGAKHHNDNFIISKILQTFSPQLAANLSRLAVETYVDSNYSIVTNKIFKNGETDQVDPNLLLSELESNTYKLPKKSRDIYLYLPYRMLNIFPTVSVFGNLDLTTGKKERNIMFYPTSIAKNKDGVLTFANGITFNSKEGTVNIGNQTVPLRYFIATEMTNSNDIKLQTQAYSQNAELVLVYMKSYGRVILMDKQIFNSTYIQMFILGKYDKDLFELVVSSPYSRIYKLKK